MSTADREALRAIADDWGVSRPVALRKLIHDQVDRQGLGVNFAAGLIDGLRSAHGAGATLEVTLSGARVDSATIDEKKPEGAKVVLVAGLGGRWELRIDPEPYAPTSLLLADLYPPPDGAEWDYRLPLADLRPEMHRS